MAVLATFQSMGLRAEKSVANYLLLKSNFAFESNLFSDIANVEFLHGHLGQTHLQPINGFTVLSTTCTFGGPCALHWERWRHRKDRRSHLSCHARLYTDKPSPHGGGQGKLRREPDLGGGRLCIVRHRPKGARAISR